MEGSMGGIYSRLRHTDRASRKVRFACLEWSATNKKLKDERLKTGQTLSQKTRVQNTQIGTGSATRGRGLLYLRPSPAPSSEITTLWVEMCSYLPQEIVEQIVGTLCDDPVSLRTSALVCRSWVSASQEQIFHSISLTSTVAWKRLIDLLKNHPHIRPLLRRLEWSLRDSDSAPVLAHPAPQLFPRVDHLIYKDGLMTFVLLASLSSLAVLELREARFITLDSALANYIAGTPSGEDLPWPLGLRSVSIRDAVAIQQTCAERWIMCNVRVDMLRELTFCLPVEEQVPAMRQALGTLTALEHLTLVIEIHLDVADLHLGTLPVSTLHLIVYADEESVLFISRIQRETSFPALRRLHITFEAQESHAARGSDGDFLFDIMPSDSSPEQKSQGLTLSPAFCSQLHSVLVDFDGITEVLHLSHFLELFGPANRPDVLRVDAGAARLLGYSSA